VTPDHNAGVLLKRHPQRRDVTGLSGERVRRRSELVKSLSSFVWIRVPSWLNGLGSALDQAGGSKSFQCGASYSPAAYKLQIKIARPLPARSKIFSFAD
jgi:hypothetical protein